MDHATEQLFALALIYVIIALIFYPPPKWRGSTTSHGTARWATEADLRKRKMLQGDGLIIGRTVESSTPVRMHDYVHTATFSPAGGGKTTGLAIPWLMDYRRGSMLVLDVKGELYRTTAKKRKQMGQQVVRLDPFAVCGPGADTFNPLDLIGNGPECVDDARAMAEAMVTRTGEEKDPHWNDQAGNTIAGCLAFILSKIKDDERNLTSMRQLIVNPEVCASAMELMRSAGGVFALMAGVIGQLEDKEKAGVFSTVHRHTTWCDSPAITASICKSSFDARAILKGNMTVFLILPPHQLEAQARWLRLIIAAFIGLIGRHGMQETKECFFLLDEAGQLGHMPPIDQGLTLLRGYGLRMAFFFQSLGQLKETFKGKEAILLDNTEQIYFAVNNLETAERVSKMLGDATIILEDAGESEGESRQYSTAQSATSSFNESFSRNQKSHGRSLLRPEEVLQLSGDYLVAFIRNVPPIRARRIKYYSDPLFTSALGGNPPPWWWALLMSAIGMVAWAIMRK